MNNKLKYQLDGEIFSELKAEIQYQLPINQMKERKNC